MATHPKRLALVAAAVTALGVGGATIANAAGDNDKDSAPITGTALDRASQVALDKVGGGHVVDSEIRDEEGFYEIEVKRADGTSFDVHLDSAFKVIDASPDGAGDKSDASGS